MSGNFGQQQFQRRQFKHTASDMAPKRVDYELLRKRIKLPAYGLIITGALSLTLTIGGLVMGVVYSSVQADLIKEQMADALFGPMDLDSSSGFQNRQVQRAAERLREQRKLQAQMVVTMIVGGVFIGALVLGSLYTISLTGGVMMMKFKNYRLCRLSCILALIPFISPLIVLGVPFGIWGLAKLARSDIRNAFD